MPRTRCMVRNCPNHSDEGFGYHLVSTPCGRYGTPPDTAISLRADRSEELFVCAPCMTSITGRGRDMPADLLRFINRLTGTE